MMRKKIVSLCMALALCLSLLPATALAAEGAPGSLYVAGQQITDEGYYTQSGGNWTKSGDASTPPSAPYFHYTKGNDNTPATLTLSGATIQGGTSTGTVPYGAGIYALCSQGQPVALTIKLIGENTITGYYGIYVNAEISADSNGTDASLTITSENNGSLEVSGSNYGIFVKSGTGNASLNIEKATVTSSTDGEYAAGVNVQSSANATGSPNISLSVNGGSLTASGTGNSDGILFYVGHSQATGATTSLTITDNAIVRANGGIKASRVDEPTPSGTGIVFDGTEGTVYGDVELQEDLEIGEGETLTIPEGASLDTNGKTITVESGGKLEGEPTGSGTVKIAPTITTESLPGGTVGEPYTETILAATGDASITWSVSNGSLPAGLSLSENGKIIGTPTTAGTSTFTVTAENSCGSDNKELSITISAPASVSVTGVSLNKDSLNLYVGGNETLTATVEPTDATNKGVTWSSSAESVATVDANGKVTAVSAGTATITVTTADGNKTATCTVTVTHVHTTTKTEARPATCTEAGNTEYWYCSGCHKYFADEAGTEETTLADTVIPATGHTFRGGWCAVCGARDPNYVPPANPNYRITVEATQGGTVTADPTAAKAGTTVTLTPVPDRGYQVGAVAVTDRFGEAVAVTEQAGGTYTFTMPNGQVTVTVTFAETPLPFTDVTEGDWFYDAVRYAYETGLMDGVGDNLFAPNSETTRAQLVTILYRLAGEPEVSGTSGFTDVEADTWYTDAVVWAAENGIVNGVSETEFAPGKDITREQLATILFRYAEAKGYDVSARADLSAYTDADQIQSYAAESVAWAVAEGLIQGFEDNTLRPAGNATRAQIATILMRFCAGVAK